MIWMGQELGFAAEKSLDPRPLDWSLLGNERNAGLHAYLRSLFRLRAATPALRSDRFEICLRDDARRVFAFKRWTDGGDVVVVAANLRHQHAGAVVIGDAALEDGPWREHVFGYDCRVEGGKLTDSLGPSEVKVFVKK